MSIKRYIPWHGKIATKIILSRLPIKYKLWNELDLFQHGAMEQPSYAYGVFKKHFDRVSLEKGFVSLELGPGDSLFSAMISQAFRGSASYLVDAGDFAQRDTQPYLNMADFLTQKGLLAPNVQNLQSLEDILAWCSAKYMTSGLSSLQTIPNKSVDFIWSHAVLEHIRRAELVDGQLYLAKDLLLIKTKMEWQTFGKGKMNLTLTILMIATAILIVMATPTWKNISTASHSAT